MQQTWLSQWWEKDHSNGLKAFVNLSKHRLLPIGAEHEKYLMANREFYITTVLISGGLHLVLSSSEMVFELLECFNLYQLNPVPQPCNEFPQNKLEDWWRRSTIHNFEWCSISGHMICSVVPKFGPWKPKRPGLGLFGSKTTKICFQIPFYHPRLAVRFRVLSRTELEVAALKGEDLLPKFS